MRLLGWLIVAVLLCGAVAVHVEKTPAIVECAKTSGGMSVTARGSMWAESAGARVRDMVQHGDRYTGAVESDTKRWLAIVGVWLRTYVLSARGEKLDPQILRLQSEAEVAAAAAEDACTPCPGVDDGPGPDAAPQQPSPANVSPRRDRGTDPAAWTAEQISIAKTAIAVGKDMKVPRRGWVVAISAGWQESTMRNLSYGDRDSLGWLQQRSGWGSVEQRMRPAYQARKFYEALRRVPGWKSLPVTVAAQRVQISAHPDAYAQWQPAAELMVSRFAGSTSSAPAAPDVQCVTDDQVRAGTRVASVAGVRTLREPTSGVTYQIPIPPGERGVALNFALDQVAQGDWYRFGSRGPDTWDCSSLVSAAWGKAGRRFTPYTEALIREVPRVDSPRPGDLLYKFGHVQMFVGKVNGQSLIVEAPRTGSKMRVRPQWMRVTAVLDPTKMGART